MPLMNPGSLDNAQAPQKPLSIRIERRTLSEFATFTILKATGPAQATLPVTAVGGSGEYVAQFILGIPGKAIFSADVDIPTFLASGTSLLAVPADTTQINVKLLDEQGEPMHELDIGVRAGVASDVTIKVRADNFTDAERIAYITVMPLFSWWSFANDVAMEVQGYLITEQLSGNVLLRVGLLGQVKALKLDQRLVISKPEFRALLAGYRDAMNATNAFYRFLCFFKAVECIYAIRKREARAAKAQGVIVAQRSQFMPTDLNVIDVAADEKPGFIPLLGKEFMEVVEDYRDVVRDAIAHLNPRRVVLNADDISDIRKCEGAIVVFKYLAREALRAEMQRDPAYHGIFIA
jgi:hypothetical protein